MTAQGFPANVVLELSPERALKAAGNAYPTVLIIATFHPLLQTLGRHDFNIVDWPPPEMISRVVPDCVHKAMKELMQPCRLLPKPKLKSKAHKRPLRLLRIRRRKDSDSE